MAKVDRKITIEKCDYCGYEYKTRIHKNWLQCPKCRKLTNNKDSEK